MGTVSDLLRVASGEVGYSRWTDEKKGTKYGRWFAALGKGSYYAENGVPYCAMFVSWCAAQAGVSYPGDPEAYCPYMVTAAKKAGKWVGRYQLQPGDRVFFDWTGGDFAGHVGIVERVFPTYIQTIEGNTSAGAAGSQSNGGLVARRTRTLDRTVMGGVRGTFTTTTSPTTSEEDELNAEEKRMLKEIHAVLTSANGKAMPGRVRNIQDILTGYTGNEYVKKGYSLPLIGARVRDIKDMVSGGGPAGEKGLLREILNQTKGLVK